MQKKTVRNQIEHPKNLTALSALTKKSTRLYFFSQKRKKSNIGLSSSGLLIYSGGFISHFVLNKLHKFCRKYLYKFGVALCIFLLTC